MSKTRSALLAVALAAPLAAAGSAPASAATAPSPWSAYTSGTGIYANALDVDPSVATVGLANSAATAAMGGGVLTTVDALRQPLAAVAPTGKTAMAHSAAANLGLLAAKSDQPALQQTLAEATSPSATQTSSGSLGSLPLSPVAEAELLPGSATASTTGSACPASGPLSTATAHAAHATVLPMALGAASPLGALKAAATGATPLVSVGGTVESVSTTTLLPSTTAGQALETSTVSTLAPITLFAGTPAALTLTFLAPLKLDAVTTGLPGGSTISYAPVGSGPTSPLLIVSAGGQSATLTSQQVLGNGGLVLALGVVDVTIGAPAHSLAGLEGTAPTTSADGTTASAAVDLVRITSPGRLQAPLTPAVDGPLAPVLNPVLTPVLSALAPLGTALQGGLAGYGVADVRVAHLETANAVPAGGIQCSHVVIEDPAPPTSPPVVTPPTGPTTPPTGPTTPPTGPTTPPTGPSEPPVGPTTPGTPTGPAATTPAGSPTTPAAEPAPLRGVLGSEATAGPRALAETGFDGFLAVAATGLVGAGALVLRRRRQAS